jgi:hypothetical protein
VEISQALNITTPLHGFHTLTIDVTFSRDKPFAVGRPMTEQFVFRDLSDLFAKANEEKSGDQLAGIAARSERERVAAKRKLADLSLESGRTGSSLKSGKRTHAAWEQTWPVCL